ncbi:MAG: thiol peroxidase [Bacillota bacterium]|nr:thiol peroxidase [Bacillota bacterium]
MRDQITMGGKPIHLVGDDIKVGMTAPHFTAVNTDMSEFNSDSLRGTTVIISVVPSVDTKVCEFQTIKFNEDATQLDNVKVLTISVDLPFAQKRFCAANTIQNSMIVSDYRDHQFGKQYGFLIEGLKLLSRGIVVIDPSGKVAYVEYVKEVTSHPDYDKVIEFVKSMK